MKGKNDPWDGLHLQEGKNKDVKDETMFKTKLDERDVHREPQGMSTVFPYLSSHV